MSVAVAGLAVAFFSIIAFWKSNFLMFMLAGGSSLMLGLYWYDVYTTTVGLGISLMLIVYSLVCLGMAFRYIFFRDRLRED